MVVGGWVGGNVDVGSGWPGQFGDGQPILSWVALTGPPTFIPFLIRRWGGVGCGGWVGGLGVGGVGWGGWVGGWGGWWWVVVVVGGGVGGGVGGWCGWVVVCKLKANWLQRLQLPLYSRSSSREVRIRVPLFL